MRTSALRYSVAGEAVVQEVGERQWQVQRRRELFGVVFSAKVNAPRAA
jgi:hypothetical protein